MSAPTSPTSCSLSCDGAGTYDLQSGPQGLIVCQYKIRGDLVTVCDEGLLKLVGAGICATLQQQNPSGS